MPAAHLILTLPSFVAPTTELDALSVERELVRIVEEREPWPGFDPLDVPLAVWDGERTWLFRHPSPPHGFEPAGDQPGAGWVRDGRHPVVTANTNIELEGVGTATLVLESVADERPLRDVAAVAVHEAFHVYQRRHHATWTANEADLFRYPSTDVELLTLRRLETYALARALEAEQGTDATAWALRAVDLRTERFAAMADEFRAYERGNELNEGLANYVELVSAGHVRPDLPAGGFGPDRVRQRGYESGSAFALLLDRLSPDWKAALVSDQAATLDGLLGQALGGLAPRPRPAEVPVETRSTIAAQARADVEVLIAERRELREGFERRTGPRLIVIASDAAPLWPGGFDPLNVRPLDGALLHTRFLRLENEHGHVELLDGAGVDVEGLTVPVGDHPLFEGIARLEVTGFRFPEGPEEGVGLSFEAAGLSVEFPRARFRTDGEVLCVEL